MARCNSCSAPLPANTNRCVYCNVRNDVDLQGRHLYQIETSHSERICPKCDKELETIKLNLEQPFYIERCNSCFGLFFDPGEIEILLESSVSHVFDINVQLMQNINRDRYQNHKQFKYVKCPVCRVLMNRVNYAHRSGVIIDQCKKHGVWVDSGEVTHLMEWKKAGGALLHEQNQAQLKNRKKSPRINDGGASLDSSIFQTRPKTLEAELLDTVSSVISRLFS